MNRHIKLALGLLLCSPGLSANDVYSHTFFSTRPQNEPWTRLTDTLVINQYHQNGRAINEMSLQATVFGGKSRNWDALRNFFLFDGLQQLTVNETLPTSLCGVGVVTAYASNLAQNILSANFNIDTTIGNQFSTITVFPKQTFVGAALSFRGPLRETWWYSLELPIIHVKNNMTLVETYTYSPNTASTSAGFYSSTGEEFLPVATMTQAFAQIGMLYGKIDGAQSKTGVADLTFMLGCDIINHVDMYLSPYGGVVFPTGNKPKAVYVFEPIVGNNHHFALLGGLTSYVAISESNDGKAWVGGSVNARYLFTNTQRRLIDLKNRPWSRYLSMYANETARLANEVTFGANLMAQEVKVKPGFSADVDLNFTYVGDCWQATLGVNTIMASAEQLRLANDWELGPQIASLTDASYTTPLRGIGNNLGPDFDRTSYILESDLDLGSAAHPAYVAHTLFITFGNQVVTDHPYTYNVGGAYEFTKNNAVMNRWTLFGTAQINF